MNIFIMTLAAIAVIIIGIYVISLIIHKYYGNESSSSSNVFWKYIFADKGERGEMRVASILDSIPEQYHVFNDVYLQNQGYSVQIDHVIISPYGVFAIETKNYSGWIFGNENSEYWTQNIYGEKHKFRNPIKQNISHTIALANTLHIYQNQIFPIVVFLGDADLKTNTESTVVYASQLKGAIFRHSEPIFAPERVSSLLQQLSASIITDENRKQRHVQSVRNTIYEHNQMVSKGLCPRCHGRLVWRQGKYGGFWGCENYPRCKFTKKRK